MFQLWLQPSIGDLLSLQLNNTFQEHCHWLVHDCSLLEYLLTWGRLIHCILYNFSEKDLPWILDVFMKKRQEGNTRLLDIEVDHGFKLFLHQRDFMAGYSIIHCVHHGIEKSRRVIFILSRYWVCWWKYYHYVCKKGNLFCLSWKALNVVFVVLCRNFLHSKWGMEEFTLAYHKAVKETKTNFVIVILKENLEMTGLRKDIKMFLTTHNYIDATKKPEQVPERLRYNPIHTERSICSQFRCWGYNLASLTACLFCFAQVCHAPSASENTTPRAVPKWTKYGGCFSHREPNPGAGGRMCSPGQSVPAQNRGGTRKVWNRANVSRTSKMGGQNNSVVSRRVNNVHVDNMHVQKSSTLICFWSRLILIDRQKGDLKGGQKKHSPTLRNAMAKMIQWLRVAKKCRGECCTCPVLWGFPEGPWLVTMWMFAEKGKMCHCCTSAGLRRQTFISSNILLAKMTKMKTMTPSWSVTVSKKKSTMYFST